jgi:hypothetical protein
MLYHYFRKNKIEVSLDLVLDPRGVIDTAETEFAEFRSEYLGKYEAIFKTA